MSAEQQYTEQEMVVAHREGFVRGALWHPMGALSTDAFRHRHADALREATRRYPLPKKVTRPRRATAPDGTEYRVLDGAVQHLTAWAGWQSVEYIHSGNALTVAALLANPTEEVEE